MRSLEDDIRNLKEENQMEVEVEAKAKVECQDEKENV